MAKIIGLPKLSPTMDEGVLVRWAKKVGDAVAIDDVLAEVDHRHQRAAQTDYALDCRRHFGGCRDRRRAHHLAHLEDVDAEGFAPPGASVQPQRKQQNLQLVGPRQFCSGIDFFKNPIGEDIYVQTYLVSKIESICSAIQRSCEALLPSSSHATYLAFYFLFQCRFEL